MNYWIVEYQNYLGQWRVAHDTNGNYALFVEREHAVAFMDRLDYSHVRVVQLLGTVVRVLP